MTAARPSFARLLIVALLALAVAFQAVRSALASNYVASDPELAARAWPDHPRVALAVTMGEIGKAAAAGHAASPTSVARAMAAARRGPLLPAPYLIQGAVAASRNDWAAAEGLFREARRRDPRSGAARFFLAQYYLGSGRPVEGLAEASALARLVTGGSAALVPGLVQYAREPGAAANLRTMLAANPDIGQRVLTELARDASNADLVIDLAGKDLGANKGDVPAWQTALLGSLVGRGDYRKAHALWLRMSGLRAGPAGLFNPQFARIAAPAPFNWTLASDNFGVAEPGAAGQLQLIYYGRDDAMFASQLLLLPPGNYQLRMQVMREGGSGEEEASRLGWKLTCQPGGKTLLALPLAEAAQGSGALSGAFTVPANCPAQLLVLNGVAREFAKSEQATINNLQLVGGIR